MSSARKRAAVQKANAEADHLRQCLMLAEHHGSVMKVMAEAIAKKHDALHAAIVRYLAENDTEGFGCACEPNYTCGPCSAHKRQQVLRDALTPNEQVKRPTEAQP